MLKVLIADDNEEFREALAQRMQGLYQVALCAEGNEALELLDSFRPDVLVLDLMLPGLDGLSLLHSAAEMPGRPAVLAVSRYLSDYIVDALKGLNVGYLMRKPCDIRATVCRVADLAGRAESASPACADPRTAVTNLLITLGIPTKLRGYPYLREAILLMAKDPRQAITKELYPAVGAMFGVSKAQVEKSIRGAILAGWSRGDRKMWRLYFGGAGTGPEEKPSNGAFISRLAETVPGVQEEFSVQNVAK